MNQIAPVAGFSMVTESASQAEALSSYGIEPDLFSLDVPDEL